MTDSNNKKGNVLITYRFPNDTDIIFSVVILGLGVDTIHIQIGKERSIRVHLMYLMI